MAEIVLLLWVWVIAGCFSLYAHSASLSEDVDLGTVLILVLAWPWWLGHHRDRSEGGRHAADAKLVPIRVDIKEEKTRRR